MKITNFLPWMLAGVFFLYVVVSWVVFFRDERALLVVPANFYPKLTNILPQIRQFLLPRGLNTVPTVGFFAILIVGFLIYFRAIFQNFSVKKIFFFAILFQVIVFFSYPILSTDVLSYILSDRVAYTYHRNVWTTRPDEFKSDPYYGLSDWNDQVRVYGAVNQFFYGLVSPLYGDNLAVNLAAHKLVVIAFVLATMVLVYKTGSRLGLIAFFWNPLLVIETAGNGHNDILMLFFLLLSYFFFKKKQNYLATGIALALATQVKITALFLLPLYAISLFSNLKIKATLKLLIAFAVVYLLSFVSMGSSVTAVLTRTFYSTGIFWQSLPQLLSRTMPALLPFVTPVFLLFVAFQCLRVLVKRESPLLLFGQTYLIGLLFFLNLWNWYSLWPLALVPFLPWGRFSKAAIAFTVTCALAYPMYWLSLRFNYKDIVWPFIIYLLILSGPASVVIYDKLTSKISR